MTNRQATVFIVDDEELVRRSLDRLVSSVGIKVQTFQSARAFLKAYTPRVRDAWCSMFGCRK